MASEYRWGGRLCLSRNNVQVIGELEPGLFSACCQNGLGTAKGTLAGGLLVVGDPALPVSGFIPYFIDLGVPRKKTVGHPTCLGPLKTSVRPLLDRVVRRPRYIPPTSALLCET